MLSSTNSVIDVKARLGQAYSDFGFATEAAFTSAITIALDDTQLLWMYIVLGEDGYSTLEDKNKVSLEETETYLYWAEVYMACVTFLKTYYAADSSISSGGSSESLKVEGYEYTIQNDTSSGSSSSTRGSALNEYYSKAIHYFTRAGWNPHQLQRGGGAFGW